MKLTAQQKAWLRGLELALAAALGNAAYSYFTSGAPLPTTRAGWVNLASIAGAAVVGGVRLYLAKTPLSAPPQS